MSCWRRAPPGSSRASARRPRWNRRDAEGCDRAARRTANRGCGTMSRAVVVTRDEPRDGPLSASLRARGLEVLWWPVVRISPPEDPRPLEDALARIADFDWIVFTSRHAVETVASRVTFPLRGSVAHVRVAAVGAATDAALRARGWDPEVTPAEPGAEALIAALAPHITPGARVLFPASSRALPALGGGLRRLGARVTQVEAYRNDAAPIDVSGCRAAIDSGAIGAVTFTSPSCVDELARALGRESFQRLLGAAAEPQRRAASSTRATGPAAAPGSGPAAAPGSGPAAAPGSGPAAAPGIGPAFAVALGPTTARALAAHGIGPVVARPPTLDGLADTTHRLLNGR